MNREVMIQKLTEVAREMDPEFPAVAGVIWILLGAIAVGREEPFCMKCVIIGGALQKELQAKMSAEVN